MVYVCENGERIAAKVKIYASEMREVDRSKRAGKFPFGRWGNAFC